MNKLKISNTNIINNSKLFGIYEKNLWYINVYVWILYLLLGIFI